MFQQALETAFEFTRPVILSRKTIAGECSSGIGAFVVVNSDGWIVTAAHILEQLRQMATESSAVRAVDAQRDAIDADNSLGAGEKRRRKAQLQKFNPKTTERYSPYWSWPNVSLVDVHYISGVDIGIGRLQGFDPSWIPNYPTFKDPARDYRPGVSLCRLGYPFHQFTPTYDAANDKFNLPAAAVPIPIFASEGVISRMMDVNVVGLPVPSPFPMKWFETSSPGLKGQSGGPLFDSQGTVWGIQSNTYPYPLGFSPKIKHDGKDHTEHQFLNVGRAVHAETVTGLFRQQGVNFQVSGY